MKNPDIHMGSHPQYDDLIKVKITQTLTIKNDINNVLNTIDAIKAKMATDLIGTSTKINTYTP